MNQSIEQLRTLKNSITSRENKLEKLQRLVGKWGQGGIGMGGGASGGGMNKGRIALDDSVIAEQKALHTLLFDLEHELGSRSVSESDTPADPGDKSNKNRSHKDGNVTDMFFRFDEYGRKSGDNKPVPQSQGGYTGPGPIGAYPSNYGPTGYGPSDVPAPGMYYPNGSGGYYLPPQATIPPHYPTGMYYPHQPNKRPVTAPTHSYPATTSSYHPHVLRDSTNQLPTQPMEYPTNPNPVHQLYSQYKKQEVYSNHIQASNNKMQLNQLLHQRQQNNILCDDHTK